MAPTTEPSHVTREQVNDGGQRQPQGGSTARPHQTLLGIEQRDEKSAKDALDSKEYTWKFVTCPYHRQGFQKSVVKESQGKGLGPMDRFLAEGPAEQYAIFQRPDNGELSLSRACTCEKSLQHKA